MLEFPTAMIHAFGVFEFNVEASELRKSGRLVALEPQPAKALALLLSRPGTLVSREEMCTHIWGIDTHVDFNRGLAYCVAQIRDALGDSGDNPRFVQTLPRRGFRFIAPVSPSASAATPRRSLKPYVLTTAALLLLLCAGWAAATFVFRSKPIVAVSRFDNETGDARYDRQVHALSDAVVDRLTGLGPDKIGIVGNAAALRLPRKERDLKRIAADTGASFVVLAQLQHKGDELSLLMQLINLEDGTHLWTRRLARPLGDALVGLDDDAAQMLEMAARQFVLRGL